MIRPGEPLDRSATKSQAFDSIAVRIASHGGSGRTSAASFMVSPDLDEGLVVIAGVIGTGVRAGHKPLGTAVFAGQPGIHIPLSILDRPFMAVRCREQPFMIPECSASFVALRSPAMLVDGLQHDADLGRNAGR